MNIEEIKKSIKFIKENSLDNVNSIKYLQSQVLLDKIEKNIVYTYCFPRPLEDYGLPIRIQEHRWNKVSPANGDESEVARILEATQTEQYGRFMKHIMHAFKDPSKVHPVAGSGRDSCCICGKELLGYDIAKGDIHSMCYGSEDSSSIICIDCLERLINSVEIIEEIDPSFLNWVKRYQLSNIAPI